MTEFSLFSTTTLFIPSEEREWHDI